MTIKITNPRQIARVTGLLYLLTLLLGIFAQFFVSGRLIVDSPVATVTNILAHRPLFLIGFAAYMIEMACQIAMTALFYILLEPVSRSVSLVAAVLGLVGCAVKTFARVFYIAPLVVLGTGHPTPAFDSGQTVALTDLLLGINDRGAGVALVFFGFYALLQGGLILGSTFLPRFLGVLALLGGAGWVTFLYPPLGHRMFMLVAPIGLMGALAMSLWLLIVGVNEERWARQAAEST